MLTFFDHDARGTRRSFLRIGGVVALGSSGLSLADLAALHARAEGMPGLLTGKSVIFLFLHGGPSQIETFDPKMDQPEGVRSATGQIATTISGRDFWRLLSRSGGPCGQAHHRTLVRTWRRQPQPQATHRSRLIRGQPRRDPCKGRRAKSPAHGVAHERLAPSASGRSDDARRALPRSAASTPPARSRRPTLRSTQVRGRVPPRVWSYGSRGHGSKTAAGSTPSWTAPLDIWTRHVRSRASTGFATRRIAFWKAAWQRRLT